jgi:hypothetical protein
VAVLPEVCDGYLVETSTQITMQVQDPDRAT